MNNLKSYFLILSLITLTNCSNEENESDDITNNAYGIITLSGEETSEIGTSLKVGKIYIEDPQTESFNSVSLLHKDVKIENDELKPIDPKNSFGIYLVSNKTTASKAISMAIVVNGKRYELGCYSPNNDETIVDCGDNLAINTDKKRVTFNNTTVVNIKSGKILTMDGIITWK